jgi:hypothetical protein
MPTPRPVARLLVGPLLRRVVGTRATVWVETSAPAVVRVHTRDGAGGEAATFSAFGHHYALVVVDGLRPGAVTPYEVFLGDQPVWPEPGSRLPASVIRTRRADDPTVHLVFGSCRETTQRATARRLPPDALDAYARRMMAAPDPDRWPDLLLMLGDQVYADQPSPTVRRLLRRRRSRSTGAPPDQVVSFDEYTALYLESWRDPEIRWLLSTVPSVMIFDDHEIVDDWNTSMPWRAEVHRQPWWSERITSGLASYWIYQHLGNLAPEELATDPVYAAVVAARDDATEVLRAFGRRVDAEAAGYDAAPGRGGSPDVAEVTGRYRWSYALDVGRTRVVVLDNRCGRVLDRAHRAMLPPAEWAWFTDQVRGDHDHLVIGSSLPWLLPPAIHHVESWNERLADSSRPRVAAFSERLRRALDLEHWAAFRRSFDALAAVLARLGTGVAGRADPGHRPPPASISVLSGDVHHSYVARARFRGRAVVTPVHQVTCSPFHNQVPASMRPLLWIGWWWLPSVVARLVARTAGVRRPPVRWRRLAGPYFGNAVGTLRHEGRTAEVTIEGTRPDGSLVTVARHRLAAG